MVNKMIYFDNAASTKPSKEVLDAYLSAALNDFENPNSLHKYGVRNLTHINRVRQNILKLLGFSSDYEVIFTSGATESNNLAILGYARKNSSRGKKIITSSVEHESVLNVFKELEKEGFNVTYLSPNNEGKFDLEEFKKEFTKDTILVSIMTVNNEAGFKTNIEEIAKIVHENPKCVLHSDCAQTLGKYKVNFNTFDLVTISGHKINGLKGIGALIKKKKVNLEPIVYGGGQENGLRSGTLDYPSIVAFNVAIENAMKNFAINYSNITKLHDYLIDELSKIEEVTLHLFKDYTPYIINFSLRTKKGSVIVEALSNKEVFVSSVSACNSKNEPLSYVLLNLGKSIEEAKNSIRLSLGKDSTIKECQDFIRIFKEILLEVRGR